ncbi:MAG TPA: thioredoxin family protein [Thermoanaerobaculia bacterium]|nr:thioredoxin family protein [Thermoanaerobaculia bacterium]
MSGRAGSLRAALGGLALLLSAAAAPALAPSAWLEGASGHQRARAEAQTAARPLLVYFYTDWCPYCREFQKELLDTGPVESYLRGLARVKINPEKGPEEARLAREYGVTGYPALFVIADGGRPQKVVRNTRHNGQPRLKTPEEFVATLRQAAER